MTGGFAQQKCVSTCILQLDSTMVVDILRFYEQMNLVASLKKIGNTTVYQLYFNIFGDQVEISLKDMNKGLVCLFGL
jgi:hypothetical protein